MINIQQCIEELIQIDRLSYIDEKPPLFKLDARVKVVVAIIGIFTATLLTSWSPALLIILLCLLLAWASKISPRMYLERMIFPFIFGAFIAMIQPFTYGTTTIHILNLSLISLPIYKEGITFGILIFSRVLAAASLLNLLTIVTPIISILDALSWLKVPRVMIDLTALIIRHIFVLAEESQKITTAMNSRMGFSKHLNYKERTKNYGILGGSLIIRSQKRAEKTYQAMLSRGYTLDSKFYTTKKQNLPNKDLAIGTITTMFFIILLISDKLGWRI